MYWSGRQSSCSVQPKTRGGRKFVQQMPQFIESESATEDGTKELELIALAESQEEAEKDCGTLWDNVVIICKWRGSVYDRQGSSGTEGTWRY